MGKPRLGLFFVLLLLLSLSSAQDSNFYKVCFKTALKPPAANSKGNGFISVWAEFKPLPTFNQLIETKLFTKKQAELHCEDVEVGKFANPHDMTEWSVCSLFPSQL